MKNVVKVNGKDEAVVRRNLTIETLKGGEQEECGDEQES